MKNDVRFVGLEEVTFVQLLDRELGEIRQLLIEKRHDYGASNLSDDGEYGIVVREGDKISRLRNLLLSQGTPNFESLEDTWLDVVGYGLLGLMMRRLGPEAFRTLKSGIMPEEDEVPF